MPVLLVDDQQVVPVDASGVLLEGQRLRGPARGHVDEVEEPFTALIPVEFDNIAVPRVQENIDRQGPAALTVPGPDQRVIRADLDLFQVREPTLSHQMGQSPSLQKLISLVRVLV